MDGRFRKPGGVIVLLTSLALLCLGACEENSGTSSFKDKRDGKKYKTVKIGKQTWLAENLNYNAEGSVCPNR
jgi:hypothetical protein